MSDIPSIENIQRKIYTIRGVQVMLDEDLSILYNVETRALNQAVKRNKERFLLNLCFSLMKLNGNLEVTICDLKLGR
jgi:hypothetical protein